MTWWRLPTEWQAVLRVVEFPLITGTSGGQAFKCGGQMEIILSQRAAEHIQSKGGRAAVDVLQHSS